MPPRTKSQTLSLEDQLYLTLHLKLSALTKAQQRMLKLMDPGNPSNVEIELARAKLEVELVSGTMTFLANGLPIQLPSETQITELQKSTAALAKATAENDALDNLIIALDNAIDAWPSA
jgi:hypothetical protein